jgi:HAD superfamily hydrolase (TIGR01509 family)
MTATKALAFDFDTVLFDVDGTLIHSNGAHADSWAQALREHGVQVDAARIRPLIGKGGDKLLPDVAGVEEDSAQGKAIGRRKKAIFARLLPSLQPTRGARALVQFLRDRGIDVVVATSAAEPEMHAILERAGVADLIPQRASKDDAEESKPDPDIVHAALRRAGARADRAVLVGDTPYDVEAAGRASVRAIALRCGGSWTDDRLSDAIGIFDDPQALLEALPVR